MLLTTTLKRYRADSGSWELSRELLQTQRKMTAQNESELGALWLQKFREAERAIFLGLAHGAARVS